MFFRKGTLRFVAVNSNNITYQLIWEQQEIEFDVVGGLFTKKKLVTKPYCANQMKVTCITASTLKAKPHRSLFLNLILSLLWQGMKMFL